MAIADSLVLGHRGKKKGPRVATGRHAKRLKEAREEVDVDYVESYHFAIGLPEILLGLAVVAAVLFGIWKVAKLLWATVSG
jgi:hypothetical protein